MNCRRCGNPKHRQRDGVLVCKPCKRATAQQWWDGIYPSRNIRRETRPYPHGTFARIARELGLSPTTVKEQVRAEQHGKSISSRCRTALANERARLEYKRSLISGRQERHPE